MKEYNSCPLYLHQFQIKAANNMNLVHITKTLDSASNDLQPNYGNEVFRKAYLLALDNIKR